MFLSSWPCVKSLMLFRGSSGKEVLYGLRSQQLKKLKLVTETRFSVERIETHGFGTYLTVWDWWAALHLSDCRNRYVSVRITTLVTNGSLKVVLQRPIVSTIRISYLLRLIFFSVESRENKQDIDQNKAKYTNIATRPSWPEYFILLFA